MPIEEFALDTIGTRRAQFFRDEEGKNYTVLLDQVILGSFSNQEELAAGREFALADGSILKVRLVNGRAEMTRNGQLLPSMSAGAVRKAKAQSEAVGEQKSLLARFFTHPTVWGLGFVVGCLLI